MPKIPIWNCSLQTFELDLSNHQLGSLDVSHSFSEYEIKNIDWVNIVYIDQSIAIYSLIVNNSQNNFGDQQLENGFTIIYRRINSDKFSPPFFIDRLCYQCVQISEQHYYIFSENLSGRYEINIYNKQSNSFTDIQVSGFKPLRKVNPVMHFNKNRQTLCILSEQIIHSYEKTSPIWQFKVNKYSWHEKFLNKDIESYFSGGWLFIFEQTFYILKQKYLLIIDSLTNKFIQLQGLKIDNKNDKYRYHWDNISQVFFILIYKSNFEENILLKMSKNSIQRIDLGVFLDNTQDITKKQSELHQMSKKTSTFINSCRTNEKKENKKFSSSNFINETTFLNIKEKYLALFTSIQSRKGAAIQFKIYEYKIPLQNLETLDHLSSKNIKLSAYFEEKKYKNYADLILIAEKKEVFCSRQLFEHYSPKFKKLYSNSNNSKHPNDGTTNVKLDHAKLHTVYFLVQQLYHQFSMPLSDLDQYTIIDLMILSQKFQIKPLQCLCQKQIQPTIETFPRLYDYIRNAETPQFRDMLIRFFVIHTQQLIRVMPIGKIQQLIRIMYTPECQHTNWSDIRFKIQNKYQIKSSDGSHIIEHPKHINHWPFVRNEEAYFNICNKCHKMLGYCQHKKSKPSNRSNASNLEATSQNNHKKDNNSN